jgi:hypothetical protein
LKLWITWLEEAEATAKKEGSRIKDVAERDVQWVRRAEINKQVDTLVYKLYVLAEG